MKLNLFSVGSKEEFELLLYINVRKLYMFKKCKEFVPSKCVLYKLAYIDHIFNLRNFHSYIY